MQFGKLLKDQILSDLKSSLKERNGTKTGALRLLLSAIQNKEIEKRKGGPSSLSDDEVLDLILREIKKRREAIELYEHGGRGDLASKEAAEIKELERYLPVQLSEAEIIKIVTEVITAVKPSGPKDMGQVIGLVMKQAKGRADSKVISELIKKELGA